MEGKMKKRISVIATALVLILIVTAFAGCSAPKLEVNTPDVESAVNFNISDMAYQNLKVMGEEYSDRTAATEGELRAAKYIAGLMSVFGYESQYTAQDTVGLQEFKTSFKRLNGEQVSDAQAYNVIMTKKTEAQESRGEIILACQYDNLYSEKVDAQGNLLKADGSFESGSAIAVMLTLAEALADVELEYDLTFAFFTAGCYEWRGAMNFVDNLDRARLDKIALVLNYFMLGGGDNWYIYTGEKTNTYGRYLNKCAAGTASSVPKDRNVGQFYLTEETIYSYTNVGMLSNQYYFGLKDIPTANFLSLNWSINDNPLFSEMKGKSNVYHTKDDTLENLISRKGEEGIRAQLVEVVKSTMIALDKSNHDTLKASLDVAKKELPNKTAQNSKTATLSKILLKVILIAILIMASYVIKHKLFRNMDKYIEARKVKEEQNAQQEDNQEPFNEKPSEGGSDAKEESKSQGNTSNKPDEDPFV